MEDELILTNPPGGRAVMSVWLMIPGVLAAPFVFWQGLLPGLLFSAAWCLMVGYFFVRSSSVRAVVTPQVLQLTLGTAYRVQRVLPVTSALSILTFETPLLRLVHTRLVIVFTPGFFAVLPAASQEQADALCRMLTHQPDGGRP